MVFDMMKVGIRPITTCLLAEAEYWAEEPPLTLKLRFTDVPAGVVGFAVTLKMAFSLLPGLSGLIGEELLFRVK